MEKKSQNYPYSRWEQEVNYYINIRLGIDVHRLKVFNWDLQHYYDLDLTPLEMYNVVNQHLRMDD